MRSVVLETLANLAFNHVIQSRRIGAAEFSAPIQQKETVRTMPVALVGVIAMKQSVVLRASLAMRKIIITRNAVQPEIVLLASILVILLHHHGVVMRSNLLPS